MGSSVARWRDAGVHEMVAWWCQYLGRIQLAQGRLDRADETYRRALDAGTAVGQPSLLAAGSAYVGMAGVAYQRGDLDTAARELDEGLALCRQFVIPDALANGLATLAWIRHARGWCEPSNRMRRTANPEPRHGRRSFPAW
jgi:LuxR family transcriptional regulator, maltose regulon positive regulatory protein